MSEPRPAPSSLVREALGRRYGLRPTTAPKDLGGSFSLNLLVETVKGRFVARVHGSQTGVDRLHAIQFIRRGLADGGVPTSESVLAVDGLPFVDLDGHLMEVERYVEHDAYMNDWHQLEVGLPYLGRTHSLLRLMPVGNAGRHPLIANYINPRQALENSLRGVQRLRSGDPSDGEISVAAGYEELARLVDEAERAVVGSLPRQMVHGDFWDNNVLFHHGQVMLVADLDFMGERLRIDDLALTFFFTNSTIGGDRVSVERIRQLRRLVDAYDSGLDEPLSWLERRSLPAAIARQPLWTIGWWVNAIPDDDLARSIAVGRASDVRWTLELMHDLTTWQDAFAL